VSATLLDLKRAGRRRKNAVTTGKSLGALDLATREWAFDLSSHDDVARNSDAVLPRLRDGSMPCDGAWSHEQIAVFQGWVEAGTPA
jgi:hypothetical protein